MSQFGKWLRKLLIFGGLLGSLLIVAAVVAWVTIPRNVSVSAPFFAQSLNINSLDFYDVGAVDLNRDGHLDLFTTNHSSLQSLLLADGRGGYSDVLATMGFSQVREIPGLEDVAHPPGITSPGLYIYFIQSTLFLRHVGDTDAEISGLLLIPGDPQITQDTGYDTTIQPAAGARERSTVEFSADGAGVLALSVTKSAPITVLLDSDVLLDAVFLGGDLVSPSAHEFELFLKDRHGIAWADINNDDLVDAYMSRGALFGSLAELPGELGDQFFVSSTDGPAADRFTELGFEKRDCPARQVAWTDADSDGRLDLYIACGRQVGGFWEYVPTALRRSRDEAPNMLYLQTESGQFRESARQYGLDFKVGGTFLWFDADLDADADLLWASENEVTLYRNSPSGFSAEVLLPDSTTIQARKLSAADFDRDGDLDVYVAASSGSNLLVNDEGVLRPVSPDEFGLPSSVRTTAWVDYDNDGLIDFYAWPDGLFRHLASGKFERTGILRMPSPYWPLVDPRALWFDYDNDGDRDFLVMQRFFPQAIQKKFPEGMPFTAKLLRNDLAERPNWLQVDLYGPEGNRDSIGAVVTLITSDGREVQQTGQFDSSHYSQGHYRHYFTFGSRSELHSLKVDWPDGNIQTISDLAGGRLYRVEWKPEVDIIE